MTVLDPIQMQKLIQHARREAVYSPNITMTSAFQDLVEFAKTYKYQTGLMVEHLMEQRDAVDQYNKRIDFGTGWKDSRTEGLSEYYDKLIAIFSGPLEDMALLVSDEDPYIRTCATWRLEAGK